MVDVTGCFSRNLTCQGLREPETLGCINYFPALLSVVIADGYKQLKKQQPRIE